MDKNSHQGCTQPCRFCHISRNTVFMSKFAFTNYFQQCDSRQQMELHANWVEISGGVLEEPDPGLGCCSWAWLAPTPGSGCSSGCWYQAALHHFHPPITPF
ncbi:hypothetical protein F7725_005342 [Dissostichus mawsoni]|uniref:Uncharacterized protein n=1 Tax=Dissostichus mawsoni TaxID=36200 RepID=A0A7J5YU38_DISMA|nr:hypothetical protein F7725_005342 [Dissostichus mawsoni]